MNYHNATTDKCKIVNDKNKLSYLFVRNKKRLDILSQTADFTWHPLGDSNA
ncbi:MAG: hypothetical protein PHT30_05515 [Bacilli bacterium]|nr:hypothetical protein [Bacilli bacterium]